MIQVMGGGERIHSGLNGEGVIQVMGGANSRRAERVRG